jgi:hypothetical protein
MAEILRWPRAKAAVITAGIHGMYAWERLGGWYRMVSLRMPEHRGALDGPTPAPAAPEFA